MDNLPCFSQEVEKWFYLAHRDLDDAVFLLSKYKPSVENACYLSQQSVEKSLKGYLVFHEKNVILTHNLILLCNQCIQIDKSFKNMKTQVAFLNPFSTKTRYERCSDITEEMGKLAVKKAEEVLEFVTNIINSSETPPKS